MTEPDEVADDYLTFPLPAGLETPALVVDLERVVANIHRLQRELDRRGIALRPHAKTHKSLRIGRLQLDAGARGLTVGTLGEAEVFVAGGYTDLFVAYPIWAEGSKAARLRDLLDAAPMLGVGVDSAAGAERLAAAIAGSRTPLRVLIEVDPGNGRTGVLEPDTAADIARVAKQAGLVVDGVFSHGGHAYRPGAAAAAGADEVEALTAVAEALEASGIDVPIVSAGSTPTMLTAAAGRVTEIRAGTYVLGDRQQWQLRVIPVEGCAAVVAATVVSVFEDRVVLDAGAKSLTKDRADFLDGYGRVVGHPGLDVARLSDYHAIVPTYSAATLGLGDVVAIIPNHICPVVDLFDAFQVVMPGGAVEIWPVDARGRSA
jgi:D-serine deaminase-like pyridoxal phosphate-dependent protein